MTCVSLEDHGIPILVIKTAEENLSKDKLNSKGKTSIWQADRWQYPQCSEPNKTIISSPFSWIFLDHFWRQGKPSFWYHQFSNYTTATYQRLWHLATQTGNKHDLHVFILADDKKNKPKGSAVRSSPNANTQTLFGIKAVLHRSD